MATATASKAKTTKGAAAAAATTKAKAKPAEAVTADAEAAAVLQLRVKALVDRVVAATDHSRKDVKAIVESALEEIGKALIAGEALSLPPLGRVRIVKTARDESGVAMTLKIRNVGAKPQGKNTDKEALAEVGEAG